MMKDYPFSKNERAILIAVIALVFLLACAGLNFQQPVVTQTPAQTHIHTFITTKIPSPTQSTKSTQAIVETTSIPSWITDFVNPILVKVVDQFPAFHDEFTSELNKGWFYRIPTSDVQPFYAHLSDGTLILKLPDGAERHDATVYSPKLALKNFVLSFDFKFGKTEPDDIFRFQFQPGKDQNITIDLSKSETWTFRWNLSNGTQSDSGEYDYFSPELINVVIIFRGNQCAVLLNHDPLGYLENCRGEPIIQPVLQAASFHLLSTSGHNAEVTMDNVKLWDLDKIYSIP